MQRIALSLCLLAACLAGEMCDSGMCVCNCGR